MNRDNFMNIEKKLEKIIELLEGINKSNNHIDRFFDEADIQGGLRIHGTVSCDATSCNY